MTFQKVSLSETPVEEEIIASIDIGALWDYLIPQPLIYLNKKL
jgi:hypothetical protein